MAIRYNNPNQTHKHKRQMATRLRSEAERQRGVGLFYSLKWRLRRADREMRVLKRETIAKYYAKLRRDNRGGKVHGQEV